MLPDESGMDGREGAGVVHANISSSSSLLLPSSLVDRYVGLVGLRFVSLNAQRARRNAGGAAVRTPQGFEELRARPRARGGATAERPARKRGVGGGA